MRICSKCKKEKDLNCFYIKHKNNKPRSQCKECEKYHHNNKPERLKKLEEKKIKEEVFKNKIKKICISCNLEKDFNSFHKRKDSIDGFRNDCKDCTKEKQKAYAIKNSEIVKKRKRTYYNKNKKTLNKTATEKRKNDPILYLKHRISCSIRRSIKRKKFNKTSKSSEVLGCSIPFFKEYIEAQFESWMNWDNYGEYNPNGNKTWNLDHKIPTSTASNIEELNKLNHYTNYRPLDSFENRMKSNSILEI